MLNVFRQGGLMKALMSGVVIKARASDHPDEEEEQLFGRARELAIRQLDRSYREVECAVVPIEQPDSGGQRLDTWYEVTFERSGLTREELLESLRSVLDLKKVA